MTNRTEKPPKSEARKIINSSGAGFNKVEDLKAVDPQDVFYTDYTEIKCDNATRKPT